MILYLKIHGISAYMEKNCEKGNKLVNGFFFTDMVDNDYKSKKKKHAL